jgi:flagellar biosynthetic protein FliR
LVAPTGVEWIASSLLISMRVAPVFALAPPFSLTQTPALFRLLFGVGMAANLAGALPAAHLDLAAGPLVASAAHELLIGGIFVMVFQLASGAIYVAGRIVDIQAGFGLALLIDPTSQSQTPMIGTFFAYAAAVVFFSLDGHADLLRIFAASLQSEPLGGGAIDLSVARLGSYAGMVFITALGVTGGAILTLFLADLAIAFLSRTVPQMNVLILGLQVKTLVLLLVLPVSFGAAGVLLARLARITLEAAPRLI